uniref:Uncharacterized protein n=1 Tax=Globodera rostochiensis TaxID=31243 RepID=A0A914ICI5_GLORO
MWTNAAIFCAVKSIRHWFLPSKLVWRFISSADNQALVCRSNWHILAFHRIGGQSGIGFAVQIGTFWRFIASADNLALLLPFKLAHFGVLLHRRTNWHWFCRSNWRILAFHLIGGQSGISLPFKLAHFGVSSHRRTIWHSSHRRTIWHCFCRSNWHILAFCRIGGQSGIAFAVQIGTFWRFSASADNLALVLPFHGAFWRFISSAGTVQR